MKSRSSWSRTSGATPRSNPIPSWLSTAPMCATVAFVYVPTGSGVERPLNLIFISTGSADEDPLVSYPRNLFVAEESAR